MGLHLAWDSKDEMEREGCIAFPWAHNAIQDQEYAPVYGSLYNSTNNKKLKTSIEETNDPEEDGW